MKGGQACKSLEALPVSLIRRAGLIQKLRILRSFSCSVKCDSVVHEVNVGRQHSCLLRILRSFSCSVKCDSVVHEVNVGRQHSCLLRSFSCSAIFQFAVTEWDTACRSDTEITRL